ncbi:MAG: hypothetical protein ABIF10_06220 [Candidatus Woesearchaeota archaeon]
MKKVMVVDVTLRDGGYINNYGFTMENVITLSRALEKAGVQMMEIGHGYGLGAERLLGKMACTDEEYISGMKGKLTKAKYGMFAMSGICTVDDVKMARRLGLDFIRIGFVDVEGPHGLKVAKEIFSTALQEGLWVSANILKNNIYTIPELIDVCKKIQELQIKNVYLVDSTGGILPYEMREHVEIIKKNFGFNIGIHAHQNLDLGVANSIDAVKAGAHMVDGTLMGIGRDAGNAQIEILIAVLKRMGYDSGIDLYQMMDISDGLLQSIIGNRFGVKSDCLMLGFAKIHSMALDVCKRLGKSHNLDWRDILQYLNKKNIKFEDETLIEGYVKELTGGK